MKGLGNLMKQARLMQERMAQLQAEMGKRTVEASAGGGMVKAVANGNGELVAIKVDKEVVDPEEVEMLEDLVTAAVNEAVKKGRELMGEELRKITGGLPIPGIF
ncbi:MAG: YbaB/EbfC family nucleoid-associated protein [Nitrospinota bacterium]